VSIMYVVTAGGFGSAVLHVMQVVMEHMAKQDHRVALVVPPEPRLYGESEGVGCNGLS